MLLYVDKKRQKRQKIKRIIITLLCCFIFGANLIAFQSLLHTSRQRLVDQQSVFNTGIQTVQQDTVSVFTAKDVDVAEVIVFPKILSRENLVTIGMVVAKFMLSTHDVYFTPEVDARDYLLRFIRLFLPDVRLSKTGEGVIITTQFETVEDIIKKRELYLRVFNYNYAKERVNVKIFAELMDERFPLPQEPKSLLAKEKAVLESFVKGYRIELLNLWKGKDISFPVQYFMLQHEDVCIVLASDILCNIDPTSSLQRKFQALMSEQIEQKYPEKLVLLTSQQEIKAGTLLDDDDGIIFRYGRREEIMLPAEKAGIHDIYTELKRRMGINTDYFDKDMKFYRFKTVEVNVNENI